MQAAKKIATAAPKSIVLRTGTGTGGDENNKRNSTTTTVTRVSVGGAFVSEEFNTETPVLDAHIAADEEEAIPVTTIANNTESTYPSNTESTYPSNTEKESSYHRIHPTTTKNQRIHPTTPHLESEHIQYSISMKIAIPYLKNKVECNGLIRQRAEAAKMYTQENAHQRGYTQSQWLSYQKVLQRQKDIHKQGCQFKSKLSSPSEYYNELGLHLRSNIEFSTLRRNHQLNTKGKIC